MMRVLILLFLFINFIFAKGEITTIYSHTEATTPSSYDAPKKYKQPRGSSSSFVTYSWGLGYDQYIDGFQYGGVDYNYTTSTNKIEFRYNGPSANKCTIFAKSNDTDINWTKKRNFQPSFPDKNSSAPDTCDMEKIMGGRIINVGVLDLFDNEDSRSKKRIERVDFIFASGIQAPTNTLDLKKAGHVATEKSGNNPIKMAVILSLDASGNPASYGNLVTVYPNEKEHNATSGTGYTANDIRYGQIASTAGRNFFLSTGSDPDKPMRSGKTNNEPMGMAFVGLDDLGVSANQTYYGYSLFGYDTNGSNPNNLVDYTNPTYFPTDTSAETGGGIWNGGNADPYGGTASYFSSVSVPTGGLISGYVFNDANDNGVKDGSESNLSISTTLKFCKSGHSIPISTVTTTGYYEFYATSQGDYTILEDFDNTNDCSSTSDPTDWVSTTSNSITLTMSGSDTPNQNFGDAKINSFDAWDYNTSNITTRALKTKIVGESFDITIASVDHNRSKNIFKTNTYSNIKAYIKSDSPLFTSPVQDLNMTELNTTNKTKLTFNTNKASKNAYVVIVYDGNNSVNSTDRFAIRPKNFDISISPTGVLTTGSDFNITIKAMDNSNTPIVDYNETTSTYNIELNSSKSGCIRPYSGLTKVNFVNGVAQINNVKYFGVGDINLSVKEHIDIPGGFKEFANIDSSDTTNTQRIIEEANESLSFQADQFIISWTYEGSQVNNSFYNSDPTEIGSKLALDVNAVDSSSNTIANFNSSCYAEDTKITIDFNTTMPSGNTIVIKGNNDELNISSADSNFTYELNATTFSGGKSSDTINVNFERIPNNPQNPVTFTIKNIDANSTTVTGNTPVNSSVDFYYIRAHAPDYYTTDTNFNATIYYEVYCKDCNKTLYPLAQGAESKDSVYWYIIDSSIYNAISPTPTITNPVSSNSEVSVALTPSIDSLNLTTSSTPNKAKITFEPDNWLLHDPYNSMPPQATFYVNFNSAAPSWVGEGDVGMTVDTNVSVQKVKRIEW